MFFICSETSVKSRPMNYEILSIKKRFEDELIDYLLELKWWEWPAKKIFDNLEALCSADLEKIKEIK